MEPGEQLYTANNSVLAGISGNLVRRLRWVLNAEGGVSAGVLGEKIRPHRALLRKLVQRVADVLLNDAVTRTALSSAE